VSDFGRRECTAQIHCRVTRIRAARPRPARNGAESRPVTASNPLLPRLVKRYEQGDPSEGYVSSETSFRSVNSTAGARQGSRLPRPATSLATYLARTPHSLCPSRSVRLLSRSSMARCFSSNTRGPSPYHKDPPSPRVAVARDCSLRRSRITPIVP
jgi:hypothetical protein